GAAGVLDAAGGRPARAEADVDLHVRARPRRTDRPDDRRGDRRDRSGAAHRAAEQTGISDAEWWEINAPVLERVMPAGRYPISGRVGQVAGQEYNAVSDP